MGGRGGRLAGVSALVVTAALALVINACGTLHPTVVVEQPLTAPPELPLSVFPKVQAQAQAAPTTTVPLPIPVEIPLDGYADEPVVEYGWIEIPRIGLVHDLFEGVTLHNIDNGPSHWPGTGTPGQPGNAVFAGHRVTHSHPFRRVDELVEGDPVIFHVGGVRSTYRVTAVLVVEPEDTWIGSQTQEATATLYACHPPGSATHRIVVQMALASTGADI